MAAQETRNDNQMPLKNSSTQDRVAGLEQQVRHLQDQLDSLQGNVIDPQQTQERAALQQALQEELAKTDNHSDAAESKMHTAGGLSLQQLNPEISVTGDFLFSWQKDSPDVKTTDFVVRGLGLHVQSWLDPYTQFKAAVAFSESETEFEEGYLQFYQFDNLVLTAGKFRQQFGRLNRWHKHALDQVDFPLPLREIFGPGGLNQTGIGADWLMPAWGGASQKLFLQVTDGENEQVFGQNQNSRPSLLWHYNNYRDLSANTYLEVGSSGLHGWNNTWDQQGGGTLSDKRSTTVLGGNLSLVWEPTDRMRYRNVEWHSEAYWLDKSIQAPDGSGGDALQAWGLTSYLQSMLSRTLTVGLRGDLYVPDTKPYAALSDDLSLSPLAVTTDNAYLYQLSPYVTWAQSPFVKFRAEYDYSDGRGLSFARHVVWLQAVFAAGPHKHDRY